MEFSRREYWSGLPFPTSGDLPDPEIEPCLLHLLHWQADFFFYHYATCKTQNSEGWFLNPAFHYWCPKSFYEAHKVTGTPITSLVAQW